MERSSSTGIGTDCTMSKMSSRVHTRQGPCLCLLNSLLIRRSRNAVGTKQLLTRARSSGITTVREVSRKRSRAPCRRASGHSKRICTSASTADLLRQKRWTQGQMKRTDEVFRLRGDDLSRRWPRGEPDEGLMTNLRQREITPSQRTSETC